MANELFLPAAFSAGDVVYVVEFNELGQAWNPTASAWQVHAGTQPPFVGHRSTIGANGSFGPFDAQVETTRWLAFSTTQTAGNESLALDQVEFDELISLTLNQSQFNDLVDELVNAGAAARPVNQTAVPPSRTWILVKTDQGWVGEEILTIQKSNIAKLFAVEFRNDLSNNGRVKSIDSVSVIAGGVGITFEDSLSNPSAYGVDRTQAKFLLTPNSAGEYTIRCAALYDPADGGGGVGDVTLIVTE
ncbi:MAG: hypothetical protein AB7U97_05240 [Pirellulales bacterium]